MEVTIELYEEIKTISKVVSNGCELWQDLAQEVSIVALQTDENKVKSVKDYLFMVCWFKWNSNNGKQLGSKDNSFKGLYRDYSIINCGELDYKTQEEEKTNRFERLHEVLNKLEPNERLIINEYLRFNNNVTTFANNCNISRRNLDLRIKSIIEKCKQLK